MNGLRETYGDDIAFVYLNANNADGLAAFKRLGLPGHPAFVLFGSDGRERFRAFGVVTERLLVDAVDGVLGE